MWLKDIIIPFLLNIHVWNFDLYSEKLIHSDVFLPKYIWKRNFLDQFQNVSKKN